MSFHSWLEYLQPVSARPGPHRVRPRCPCRQRSAGHKLLLEPLEDRSLPSSGGLSPTLVALGGATPRPIPLPLWAAASPFNPPGFDIYANYQGPADAPLNPFVGGNEPNTITDFIGIYGGVRVQGTGIGHQGNEPNHSYFWDADLRFMQGVYRGLNGRLYARTFVEV
jgi:hypothetical protein